MRWIHCVWTLLTFVLVAGCSNSDVAEVPETSDQASKALAETLPLVTEFENSGGLAENSDELITPFDENLDFFSAPKMIMPIEAKEPDEDFSGELPPLRLVGFVGAAGDKAMVAVDGKMHIVTAGKRFNGIEIVSIKSPDVALRWGETELTLNFYKPSKADRAQPEQTPSLTSSSGLTNVGQRPNHQDPANVMAKSSPAPSPRPRVSLPSLPGLPAPGNTGGSDHLSDFPDLGAGPGERPAP